MAATTNDAATSVDEQMRIRDVVVEAARAQLAATRAAITLLTGWVEAASRFADALSRDVIEIAEGKSGSGEIVTRSADLSRAYLRDLTELPRRAVDRFEEELGKNAPPRPKPARAARAKD